MGAVREERTNMALMGKFGVLTSRWLSRNGDGCLCFADPGCTGAVCADTNHSNFGSDR